VVNQVAGNPLLSPKTSKYLSDLSYCDIEVVLSELVAFTSPAKWSELLLLADNRVHDRGR